MAKKKVAAGHIDLRNGVIIATSEVVANFFLDGVRAGNIDARECVIMLVDGMSPESVRMVMDRVRVSK